MFEVSEAARTDPDRLAAAFLAELDSIATANPDSLPVDCQTALASNDPAAITLAQAANILAIDDDRLDDRAIEAELRDRLLIGMSTAVLDVDRLATQIALDRSPKELQQRIEGRESLSLLEYAHIRSAIAARTE